MLRKRNELMEKIRPLVQERNILLLDNYEQGPYYWMKHILQIKRETDNRGPYNNPGFIEDEFGMPAFWQFDDRNLESQFDAWHTKWPEFIQKLNIVLTQIKEILNGMQINGGILDNPLLLIYNDENIDDFFKEVVENFNQILVNLTWIPVL